MVHPPVIHGYLIRFIALYIVVQELGISYGVRVKLTDISEYARDDWAES